MQNKDSFPKNTPYSTPINRERTALDGTLQVSFLPNEIYRLRPSKRYIKLLAGRGTALKIVSNGQARDKSLAISSTALA